MAGPSGKLMRVMSSPRVMPRAVVACPPLAGRVGRSATFFTGPDLEPAGTRRRSLGRRGRPRCAALRERVRRSCSMNLHARPGASPSVALQDRSRASHRRARTRAVVAHLHRAMPRRDRASRIDLAARPRPRGAASAPSRTPYTGLVGHGDPLRARRAPARATVARSTTRVRRTRSMWSGSAIRRIYRWVATTSRCSHGRSVRGGSW